jgi:hypothetical protein
MTQPATLAAPARPTRRRWRTALVLVVLLATGLAAAWWDLVWSEERDYQAVLAELDQLDAGWRFADLDAARAKIADEDNAALQVLKVRRMGVGGGLGLGLEEQIGALPANVQLNGEQTAALVKFFDNNAKARAEAHRLKDFATGRYPNVYDPKEAKFNMDWVQQTRELAHFLQLSALLAVQDGDPGQLADICRAGINNARAMGDEPSAIGMLVRIAIMEISLGPLERGVAQVELPPAELRRLQELVQSEIDEPRLTCAIRGERAISLDMIEATRDGRLARSTLVVGAGKGWRSWVPTWLPMPVAQDRAAYLRGMTAIVEATKQAAEKQLDAIDEAAEKWRGRDWLLDNIIPTCTKVSAAHIRNNAKLRCTLLALAAERYRQEHGSWPANLDALVQAGHLKSVPVDPYDARPVRYKRLPDGVLFYSVGVDRVDDGGNVDRNNPIGPGADLGFRLYDPEARRRPAMQK